MQQKQKQIGRYEIRDELGAGGMGTVYRALDPQGNREVALKVINLDALRRFAAEKREEVLKRFSHEVRVIAQLQHVAIVPLFDSGDDNGTPWGVESEGFWPLFFPTETLSLLNVNLF